MPSHTREASDASSAYRPGNRLGHLEADQAYVKPMDSQRSSTLQPGEAKDARLSEFYEAYYRNSHMAPAGPPGEPSKAAFGRHSTILEVDSPMASPMFPPTAPPGAAF